MPTLQDEIKDLTKALKEKKAEVTAITDTFEVKDGRVQINQSQAKAYQDKQTQASDILALLQAKQAEAGMTAWLDAPAGLSASAQANAAGYAAVAAGLGAQVVTSQVWQEFKSRGYRGRMVFEQDGLSMFTKGIDAAGGVEVKDVYSAMAGNVSLQALGHADQRPLVERLPRLMHVRDIFPPESTTAAMLWGIRQTGFTNNAATVRERYAADGTSAPTGGPTDVYGKLPKSDIALSVISYPVATVGHTMPVHRNTLEDEPRVQGLMSRNLIEGVRLREDDQVLFGDGTGANIRGICNTTGVQTYDQPMDTSTPPKPTELKNVTLRRAITLVQLAEMAPTGIIVNPLDWEDLELETDANGRYLLVTQVAVGAEQRVWRLPVITTTAMPEGKYLLGAFGLGAQLFDRRQIEVEVSTENSDNFERDVVSMKGSERVALTVDRPEAFVQGTLYVG